MLLIPAGDLRDRRVESQRAGHRALRFCIALRAELDEPCRFAPRVNRPVANQRAEAHLADEDAACGNVGVKPGMPGVLADVADRHLAGSAAGQVQHQLRLFAERKFQLLAVAEASGGEPVERFPRVAPESLPVPPHDLPASIQQHPGLVNRVFVAGRMHGNERDRNQSDIARCDVGPLQCDADCRQRRGVVKRLLELYFQVAASRERRGAFVDRHAGIALDGSHRDDGERQQHNQRQLPDAFGRAGAAQPAANVA